MLCAGISIETAEAEAADKKPKKVVYTTKKSQKKKEDTAKVRPFCLSAGRGGVGEGLCW